MTTPYGRDPHFVPDEPLRAPGGTGRVLHEVRPFARPEPEPIKENNPMSETKTELTDQLALEAYNELYIGQSLSRNRCAELLAVRPDELEKCWDAQKLRQRNRKEAMRARNQPGKPWEWGAAEAALDALVGDVVELVPQSSESLAEHLGAVIPDTGRQTYANGNLEPGPGQRAVPVDEFDSLAQLEPGQTVAFKIQDGELHDLEKNEAETLLIPAAALEAFSAALDTSTLNFVLTDLRFEADPGVNLIRGYLAAAWKQKRGGNRG